MKKIAFFNLGGTISGKGENRNDLKNYQSGLIDGKEFLNHLPELNKLANIEVIPIDNVSSTQIDQNHWTQLKNQIEYYLNESNYQGIVITHDTSTRSEEHTSELPSRF